MSWIERDGAARGARRASRLIVLLAALAWPGRAVAETRLHALIIGNNAPFRAAPSEPAQPPLHYADDDAAAFAELLDAVTTSTELLTLMDRETQELYPALAGRARAPTLDAVKGAVTRLSQRLREQHDAGHRNVVFVFFSGHGTVDFEGHPALALSDGGLDQTFLYEQILARLPADEVHVLIDACHAEAVVRPRDLEAEAVTVSAAQASAFLVEHTLLRFPHVGAIVAATTDKKAHEWDALGHGIFTHELLSALRGGADVNHDRRLEYSEVYAFMTAANREVSDRRARLAVVARPPDSNRRAALLTLTDFPAERAGWLVGIPGHHGIVEVGDERGRRLATLHGDREFLADVLLPAGSTVFVSDEHGEARYRVEAGRATRFDALTFTAPGVRERGALAEAVRRGLFAAEYGRPYYQGIVDQTEGFLPVEFSTADAEPAGSAAASRRSAFPAYALVLGGGLSTGVADSVTVTHGVNVGLRRPAGSGVALSLALLTADQGPLREWHLRADAGFLWSLGQGKVRGHFGALAGGGLLNQAAEGMPARRAGFVAVAPVLGLTVDFGARFGFWSELDLSGAFYQRDDRLAFSFMPAAWLGGSLRL
jgi:uncharacterized caspase-like protein